MLTVSEQYRQIYSQLVDAVGFSAQALEEFNHVDENDFDSVEEVVRQIEEARKQLENAKMELKVFEQ